MYNSVIQYTIRDNRCTVCLHTVRHTKFAKIEWIYYRRRRLYRRIVDNGGGGVTAAGANTGLVETGNSLLRRCYVVYTYGQGFAPEIRNPN